LLEVTKPRKLLNEVDLASAKFRDQVAEAVEPIAGVAEARWSHFARPFLPRVIPAARASTPAACSRDRGFPQCLVANAKLLIYVLFEFIIHYSIPSLDGMQCAREVKHK
jgi:hypothetical protein